MFSNFWNYPKHFHIDYQWVILKNQQKNRQNHSILPDYCKWRAMFLHMSPKTTMEVCQKLYQGGFITYMRTESTKYSKSFLEKSSLYIENIFKNKKYIGNVDKLERTRIQIILMKR